MRTSHGALRIELGSHLQTEWSCNDCGFIMTTKFPNRSKFTVRRARYAYVGSVRSPSGPEAAHRERGRLGGATIA